MQLAWEHMGIDSIPIFIQRLQHFQGEMVCAKEQDPPGWTWSG